MIFREWDWDTAIAAFPPLFEAMWKMTLGLTIASYLFALVFGFVWTFLRRIPFKPLNRVITFIMEFIRTTPPLVQLLFLYYAWPMAPDPIAVTLSPLQAGIIGLGVHFSTYISEIYRSGIESIQKGQWEAAKALNFTRFQTWTKIILPQAIPPVVPMLGNYLIIMFKEVPLTAAVGVSGMLFVAQYDIGAKTYEYVEALTIVALLFLLLSYPSAILIQKLERKMNRRFDKKADSSKNGKEVTSS